MFVSETPALYLNDAVHIEHWNSCMSVEEFMSIEWPIALNVFEHFCMQMDDYKNYRMH